MFFAFLWSSPKKVCAPISESKLGKKGEQEMTKRRQYTEEFKREAVKMVVEQGDSQTDAARSLGIHPNRVWQWYLWTRFENANWPT